MCQFVAKPLSSNRPGGESSAFVTCFLAAVQACRPAGVDQAGFGPWGTGLGAEGGGGHLGKGPMSKLRKEAVCALEPRRSRREESRVPGRSSDVGSLAQRPGLDTACDWAVQLSWSHTGPHRTRPFPHRDRDDWAVCSSPRCVVVYGECVGPGSPRSDLEIEV